ncbi:right-handed parallel beta-helix repeat-containing protein [Methanobrevibacter sp. DSM 116169]|uniref:right-handed parallel beta-helix repeat-containing protein n=1 Tax=Methanobrevibacter sp. DSM 116169 TaxID=3242727 RepID=UPI0038FC7D9F
MKKFKILLLFLVMILSIGCISAQDFDVAEDGSGAYDNINDAVIDLSSSSDNSNNIYIQEGLYNKSNDVNNNITKNVNIIGVGNVVIDGNGINGLFRIMPGIEVTFTNIKFYNSNPGAIFVEESSITVINCYFENGVGTTLSTAESGGITLMDATGASIVDSTFVDNDCVQYGGAIYGMHSENIFIDNCNFISNSANGAGGAIYLGVNHFTLTNSNFTGNKAKDSFGGALYLEGNNLLIMDCLFDSNQQTADYGGSAIFVTASENLTVMGSNFTNNFGDDSGPLSIYFTMNSLVSDCLFEDNLVGTTGTLFYGYSSNIEIRNVDFINNFAKYHGAGLAFWTDCENILVENCDFINNTAVLNAGAIISRNTKNISISKSNFKNNSAPNGGAIYVFSGSKITIDECIFEDNNATDGGAINVGERVDGLTINSSTFNENEASHVGGAINSPAIYGLVEIINSVFNGNTAVAGGAIRTDSYNMTISNSNFVGNKAELYGGDILNVDYNLTITDSNFSDSSCIQFGGSIFNEGYLTLKNNLINNTNAAIGNEIYNVGFIDVVTLTFLNNETKLVVYDNTYIIFATVTDDMGNEITYQNVSFYINGIYVGFAKSIEGYANISYTVTERYGSLIVNGYYDGIISDLILKEGALQLISNTTVIGEIVFDKDLYVTDENVEGTITIENLGNHTHSVNYTAENVTIIVNLPAGFEMNNDVIVSHGTYNVITGIWFIDELDAMEVATMTFTGKFTTKGNYNNNIFVNGLNFENSTDSYEVTVLTANTIVESMVKFEKEIYFIDEDANGVASIINNGNYTAENVTVVVEMPKGFIVDGVSHGTYDENTNIWYIGDLNAGEVASLNYSGTFTSKNVYNATIFVNGMNFENSTSFHIVTVLQALTNLEGNIAFDKEEYAIGEDANGVISVENKGNYAAENVIVEINLAESFDSKNIIVSHGYYENGLWHIGDLNPGEIATMIFTGKFTVVGEFNNTIFVYGTNFENFTAFYVVNVKNIPSDNNNTNKTTGDNGLFSENSSIDFGLSVTKTGNPIFSLILVLIACLGISLRRKI